ncbi:Xylulose-5-phosphate phosphoketolase [Labilithrix luteola]|uniref:Probable phosphoketolase n=1 Tax=Labilithrix luteola TaxID=1391654 RepID=A0A0K1PPM6_9BACT|nr:phosphoketolase family protein [Labilithrix luteola]AKU95472.1 Xylulose-5-phosphate phosphoketolase [Labilithrix luteola]
MAGSISRDELLRIDAWWRAANYLTVGQIYLQENPLLREPLQAEHIKPRLLGHWGTSPGLNLLYAHLNRIVRERDLDAICLAGPGHGGPAIVANVYLEGSYSEVYPRITRDVAGMRALFRQFSTPGGIPSHVGPQTPGSIHEGGELGYVLTHAFGAVFDNPGLVAVAVVGDGEAETGPLEGSWKGISFLNPVHDGAVLPVLHLNGYKIAGPTVLGRSSDEDIERLLTGHGYAPCFVEGSEPERVHRALAAALDRCFDTIEEIRRSARERGQATVRPRWPVLVLRTPKGWTGPKEVGGVPVEGTFRAHQVPLNAVRTNSEHRAMLERWMKSYRPEELFDAAGRLLPDVARLAPSGDRRMGKNPHTNGGLLAKPLELPDFKSYAIDVPRHGAEAHESTRRLGMMLRDIYRTNPKNFRLFCPDETNSNRLGAVFELEDRCLVERTIPADEHVSPSGRVMEVLSEHNCEGWLEGYVLTGRHGLFATYEAFALIVASMTTQHAKWLEASAELPWRASVPSLNLLLTSTCWRNDHNGFSHQGPGFMDTILSKKGTVARIYLPPDANCLLSIADRCLRSKNCVNLVIIDKQPQLQWLPMDEAREHCARGASVWNWASSDEGRTPDVVLACAGDIATLETLAAAWWLRKKAPELRVRVVNVVDLMSLASPSENEHGMTADRFESLFTADTDVVFAFHGYAGAVHQLLHGRPRPSRFHVRGYREEGSTTTPFDMVVLNETSRFHLVIEALRRSRRPCEHGELLADECRELLKKHSTYVREHFEDMPEIRSWRWGEP